MAVNLPSDLIADVMRNAEPAQRNAAVARLQSLGAGRTEFAAMVDGVAKQSPRQVEKSADSRSPSISGSPGTADTKGDQGSVYRGFERMVLRNLFETLLPDESSGAFGAGPSAGIWRSMAADQFAGVYSENGGIGIASLIASSGGEQAPRRESQWPYFALGSLQLIGTEA